MPRTAPGTIASMTEQTESLPPVPEQPPLPALARWLLFVFAVLCLALGVIFANKDGSQS